MSIGGRGASSGISNKGKPYGSEYTTLYQSGNIKFVRYNDTKSAKTPMETMTKGRIYATINELGKVLAITYYDKDNKRYKQIDVYGKAHMINGKPELPHTHKGYFHNEHGDAVVSPKEKKMIDRILEIWDNRKGKS